MHPGYHAARRADAAPYVHEAPPATHSAFVILSSRIGVRRGTRTKLARTLQEGSAAGERGVGTWHWDMAYPGV